MKIFFVTPSFFPATYYGGPIFSTYNLARALTKNGLDIRVISTNANGKERLDKPTGIFIKDSENLQIKYYKSLDSRGTSISLLTNLKNDLKAADIIYLVSVFSPPTPLTLYLSKKLNKPLVIAPNGELGSWCLNQGSRFKKLWLKLFISPFIKRIYWHVTSEDEEKMVRAVYPNAKTFVLPNGIDLEEFSSLPFEKNKSFYDTYTGFSCAGKKIIVSMGRLHKIKGFDILIEAFHALQKEFSNAVLLIAGEDFGEKSNLEKMINQYNLNNKVFLVGKLDGDEKLEFLHNADVFALASHHENFGMVVVEALACGCAVVISKKVGIYQQLMNYDGGIIVDNDSDGIKKGIIELLSDNQFVKNKAANGLRFVEEKYNVKNIANELVDIFSAIIGDWNDTSAY
ncbi:MAG: hypothetical protein A2315_15930 [Ignavibacteria bacterium RIFOXYB2_FULL_35_12]|nr:MAG: hypothetical protein A2058_01020 [Ignavibacteria bacterium GWA2_36_19]OGU60871.1 MAG: hypothetical protein A2X60_15460 [Ignavibacteria bacterium GWF2_35_20]OGU80693.1 MAG: hypothetical protein A2254_17100 [Ignavibacteria bacterium RIFOXYA2_FULL_35_9]OGU92079.1 MAG: hypothetical protein A3K31_12760 [Ignavibacteria bacterium RIFOXYA12_FULL_35_25]OGU95702.1 MAG: hypothetical protein A2347_01485 [Ignavibacteria bacterium RIFOXYB12_FULL_35_14]OGU98851.1 MAG: hypothetical protein A2455_02640